MLTLERIQQAIASATKWGVITIPITQTLEQISQAISGWAWPNTRIVQGDENLWYIVEHSLRVYRQVTPQLLTSSYRELAAEGQIKHHIPPQQAPPLPETVETPAPEKKRDAFGPAIAADKPIPIQSALSESTAAQDAMAWLWHEPNYKNKLDEFRMQARREAPIINGMIDHSFETRRFNELKAALDMKLNAKKTSTNILKVADAAYDEARASGCNDLKEIQRRVAAAVDAVLKE